MSVPVTVDLPDGFRRVAWPGRLGDVAAVHGTPDRARGTALLIHGFTGSKEDYFAVLEPLHRLGWSVAAVDLPGMAESEGPDEPAHYSLAGLGADIADMVGQLAAGPVHVVGHSVGGILAREAVLLAPELVRSLTLYDSGTARVGPTAAADIELLHAALQHHTPGQVQLLKEAMDETAGNPAPPAEIVAFLRERWNDTSPGHLLGMADIARSAPDRVSALAALRRETGLPIMVLYGAQDTDVWDVGDFADLGRRLQADTVALPGTGHSPAVEDPAAMVAALDRFWSEAP